GGDPGGLHGNAGRAVGTDAFVRRGRYPFRSDGDHLFRESGDGGGDRPPRYAGVARQVVRGDAPQCGAGDGVLPDSGEPAGGAGGAGRELTGGETAATATATAIRSNGNGESGACRLRYEAPPCRGIVSAPPSGHPWPESGTCAIHGALSAIPRQDAASRFVGCGFVRLPRLVDVAERAGRWRGVRQRATSFRCRSDVSRGA